MTAGRTESVVVLGTTLAGLVAAYELARQGYRLTVIEHPGWTDDLAASAHILGCHTETHALLRSLPDSTPLAVQQPMPLEFFLSDRRIVSYRPTTLPGSLHWIAGLVRFRGLSWNDRWQLLSYLERIWEQELTVPTALDQRTAAAWLASTGQSQSALDQIWSPLVRFLTGNALTDLSASSCARMLAPPFLTDAGASRCTRLDRSTVTRLHERLRHALSQLGARILTQTDLPHIQFGQHRIDHLRLCDGHPLNATWYVSGISHQALLTLLPDRLLTRYGYFSHLTELTDLPGISLQFRGLAPTTGPRLGLIPGETFQTVTVSIEDASTACYELSAVGDLPFIGKTDEDLISLARRELTRLFPDVLHTPLLPNALHRHPRAALSLASGTAMLRPIQQSPVQNLLVAGAWTDTGWPANTESTVVSARQCLKIIAGPSA